MAMLRTQRPGQMQEEKRGKQERPPTYVPSTPGMPASVTSTTVHALGLSGGGGGGPNGPSGTGWPGRKNATGIRTMNRRPRTASGNQVKRGRPQIIMNEMGGGGGMGGGATIRAVLCYKTRKFRIRTSLFNVHNMLTPGGGGGEGGGFGVRQQGTRNIPAQDYHRTEIK